MFELIVGAIVGLALANRWALDPTSTWTAAVLVALIAYMLSCWRFPFRACWWCDGRSKRGDKRGNYRITSCWICAGQSYVRFGARLLGRG